MELHEQIAEIESRARQGGEQAFAAGKRMADCPHQQHTREAELWRRGFANARFGAQQRINQ
jgi:ribosome modulation factor